MVFLETYLKISTFCWYPYSYQKMFCFILVDLMNIEYKVVAALKLLAHSKIFSSPYPETEFLDVIGTKVLKVLPAIHSHIY